MSRNEIQLESDSRSLDLPVRRYDFDICVWFAIQCLGLCSYEVRLENSEDLVNHLNIIQYRCCLEFTLGFVVERVKFSCLLTSPISPVPETRCQDSITSWKQYVERLVHSYTTDFCLQILNLASTMLFFFFLRKTKGLTLKKYNNCPVSLFLGSVKW